MSCFDWSLGSSSKPFGLELEPKIYFQAVRNLIMKNQQDRRMHINCGPLVEALTRRRFLALSATATLAPRLARAQDATTIRPYLQSVTPDSVWICWRTDSGTETTVR